MRSSWKNYILVVLLLVFTPIFMGSKSVDTRLKLDFYCNEKHVCTYEDKPINTDIFPYYTDVVIGKINAPLNEKQIALVQNFSVLSDYKRSVLSVFPTIQSTVNECVKNCSIMPIDSKIYFYSDPHAHFRIVSDKDGLVVNENKLYENIYFSILSSNRKVNISLEKKHASTLVQDNQSLCFRKAKFTTSLATSSLNRKRNVLLALSKINGLTLYPNEKLSFNERVGARTIENGFLQAKIILDGEYVDGVGGGVCQASTTLYNCALLAGLKVESVRSHSLLPSYVEPSFDAMVNSGSSDLVISNPFSFPVFISAYSESDVAVVEIFGKRNEFLIKRVSNTVFKGNVPSDKVVYEKQENGLSDYRKSYGCPLLKSEGFLEYYKDGILVKSERIRSDTYNEKQGVIVKYV